MSQKSQVSQPRETSLKTLTLEMLHDTYNISQWTHKLLLLFLLLLLLLLERERETDRQTVNQTDTQTHRQKNTH